MILNRYILLGLIALLGSPIAKASHHQAIDHNLNLPTIEIKGTFAGTMQCHDNEVGLTLTLQMDGYPTWEDFPGGLCRSGSGPCNDRQEKRLSKMRNVSGMINYFPTLSNSEYSSGAYSVEGVAEHITNDQTKIFLNPGGYSLKRNGIDRHESSLEARFSDGILDGKFYSGICANFRLNKIQLAKPK